MGADGNERGGSAHAPQPTLVDGFRERLSGKRTAFRALVVVDDYTRENVAVEVDTSISGLRVRRVLEAVVIERGRPGGIVVDNGPEFRSRVMEAWSEQRRVPLQFIEPG